MALRIPKKPKSMSSEARKDAASLIHRLWREMKHERISAGEHKRMYRAVTDAAVSSASLICTAPDGTTRWRLDVVKWPKTGKLVAEVSLWHGYTDTATVITGREIEAIDRVNVASGNAIWDALGRWEPTLVNGALMTHLRPHADEEGVHRVA